MEKLFNHPQNKNRTVFGKKLKGGDKLQEGDVYASTSGNWEVCPCPGVVLKEGCEVLWVRPIN